MHGIQVATGVCLSYKIAYVLGVHFKSGEWGRKRCGSVVTTFYSGRLWCLIWTMVITNHHLLHRSVTILYNQEVHQDRKSRFRSCRVVVRSTLPILANTFGCKGLTNECCKTTYYAGYVVIEEDRTNPCPCGTSQQWDSLLHVTCSRVGSCCSSSDVTCMYSRRPRNVWHMKYVLCARFYRWIFRTCKNLGNTF